MTVFECISSKNIDELVEWLDTNGAQDNNPWIKWFDNKYCRNCKPIIKRLDSIPDWYPKDWNIEHEFGYCELNNNCMYFQDMKRVPDRKQTIKLWLESEI